MLNGLEPCTVDATNALTPVAPERAAVPVSNPFFKNVRRFIVIEQKDLISPEAC